VKSHVLEVQDLPVQIVAIPEEVLKQEAIAVEMSRREITAEEVLKQEVVVEH
jgi:hypothetical protein